MTAPAIRPSARRRAFRGAVLALTAGTLVVGTSACTGGDAEADGAATTGAADVSSPSSAPTADATGSAPAGGDLLDGTRQVDLQTYGGQWVTTTAEGGVTTVADPAEAGGVPTTWVVEPLGDGTSHVRTTATTDGQGQCLSVPGDDVVGTAACDPAAADQRLTVAALDQPDQVNISAATGVVVADQEGGLAVEPDPSSPASVFTLVDRGPAAG